MGICLFHQRWIKTFYTQPFGQLCIKYGLILQELFGRSFTKKLISGSKKWKMNFSSKQNENFLRKHCLPFQYAPLCTIRDHFNKLCQECGHKIDHLAWKPWIFTHDSSFLRTLFKNNFRITNLLFFLETWSHIMTQCEGFPIFLIFFEFFMPVSKCGQNGRSIHS